MNLGGMAAPVFDAAVVYVEKLRAAGITAFNDPRSATPPCVLVSWRTTDDTDPDVTCGIRVSWQFACLAPGVANADAQLTLDRLEFAVRGVLGRRARSEFSLYNQSADSPAIPAHVIEFDEDITL